MNTKTIAIGVLVAGLLALVGTFAAFTHIRREQAARLAADHAYQYVTASTTVAQGSKLKQSDLAVVPWGGANPVAGAYTTRDEQNLIGRVAAYQIPAGMVITRKLLATATASMNLPTKVPPGMRAIAIKTDEVNDIGGFLFPGAKVDILADIKVQGGQGEDRSYDVAEDITVLTTGQQLTPDPSGKPVVVDIVTVLVTPEQAQKLALAQQEGSIYFTLRNSRDTATVSSEPTTLNGVSAAVSSPTHGSIAYRRARPVRHPRPTGIPVQTILGGQTQTEYFYHNLPVAPPHAHSLTPSLGSGAYPPSSFGGAN